MDADERLSGTNDNQSTWSRDYAERRMLQEVEYRKCIRRWEGGDTPWKPGLRYARGGEFLC